MSLTISTREISTDVFAIEADGMRIDTVMLTADGYFASMDTMRFGTANLNANVREIVGSMV